MDDPALLHRFSLVVPPSGADLAVGELMDLAPEGFEEEEAPHPGGARTCFRLWARPEHAEALAASLGALASLLREETGEEVTLHTETVPDQNWREAWKVHFTLQRIGPFVVRPSWIDYDPAPGEQLIHLDPGSAFGTGLHETTRLCLRSLADLAARRASPRRVLDFGTGTGILGIAACRLFPCRVLAVDSDPLALAACEENAERNGVADRFTLGSTLAEDRERADLVLANVSRPVLVEVASALVQSTAPGGTLVLSGLLLGDEAAVVEAYALVGATPKARTQENDWLALELGRGDR